MLKLRDVWRVYKLGRVEVPALRGMDLEIKDREFAAIMGPSGSGKSTLLHILGLLDRPDKGKVFLEGKDVEGFSENELSALRGRRIGFVFQQFNLLPNLTTLENVALPMVFLGVARKRRVERARLLLERFGLGGRLGHRPGELSGGEQQRVAIARALANNPKIVLADEPTGNLDSKTGRLIMESLRKVFLEEAKTIILVTHDPEVASYAKRIIRLKDGRLQEGRD